MINTFDITKLQSISLVEARRVVEGTEELQGNPQSQEETGKRVFKSSLGEIKSELEGINQTDFKSATEGLLDEIREVEGNLDQPGTTAFDELNRQTDAIAEKTRVFKDWLKTLSLVKERQDLVSVSIQKINDVGVRRDMKARLQAITTNVESIVKDAVTQPTGGNLLDAYSIDLDALMKIVQSIIKDQTPVNEVVTKILIDQQDQEISTASKDLVGGNPGSRMKLYQAIHKQIRTLDSQFKVSSPQACFREIVKRIDSLNGRYGSEFAKGNVDGIVNFMQKLKSVCASNLDNKEMGSLELRATKPWRLISKAWRLVGYMEYLLAGALPFKGKGFDAINDWAVMDEQKILARDATLPDSILPRSIVTMFVNSTQRLIQESQDQPDVPKPSRAEKAINSLHNKRLYVNLESSTMTTRTIEDEIHELIANDAQKTLIFFGRRSSSPATVLNKVWEVLGILSNDKRFKVATQDIAQYTVSYEHAVNNNNRESGDPCIRWKFDTFDQVLEKRNVVNTENQNSTGKVKMVSVWEMVEYEDIRLYYNLKVSSATQNKISFETLDTSGTADITLHDSEKASLQDFIKLCKKDVNWIKKFNRVRYLDQFYNYMQRVFLGNMEVRFKTMNEYKDTYVNQHGNHQEYDVGTVCPALFAEGQKLHCRFLFDLFAVLKLDTDIPRLAVLIELGDPSAIPYEQQIYLPSIKGLDFGNCAASLLVMATTKKGGPRLCLKCGRGDGHTNKSCKHEGTSFGVIAYSGFDTDDPTVHVPRGRLYPFHQKIHGHLVSDELIAATQQLGRDGDDQPQKDVPLMFLLVERKDTIGFLNLVQGCYPENEPYKSKKISKYVSDLICEERCKLTNQSFAEMWAIAGTSRRDYVKSEQKWNGLDLGVILNTSECKHREADYMMPKGRLKLVGLDGDSVDESGESGFGGSTSNDGSSGDCCMYVEKFIGTDGKKYRNVFFVGRVRPCAQVSTRLGEDIDQSKEVRNMGWFTLKECEQLMRSTHNQKLDILKDVYARLNPPPPPPPL
ncbi:UNVERIFIED_CONTAM: hypothetical protein HDU68_007791 [Siphonaria sp. JEL0065]|nr:hypothetical protein HDU68_007791 [Siphonaria sp. JEL0065]